MEIPGFYYDVERKKYFKIVNGSGIINPKYHNNTVQAKKRQTHAVGQNDGQIKRKKGDWTPALKILEKKKHNNDVRDALGIKLGLIKLDKPKYDFERIKCLAYERSIDLDVERIWGVMNGEYIVASQGCNLITMDCKLIERSNNLTLHFETTVVNYYVMMLNNSLQVLLPKIRHLAMNDGFVFSYIIMEHIDSNWFHAIAKFRKVKDRDSADLSWRLSEYISNISDTVTKDRLVKLFGLDLITIDNENIQYTTVRGPSNDNRKDMVTSCSIERYNLCVGTLLGSLYIFEFDRDGIFHNHTVFRIHGANGTIKKIIRYNTNTIICCESNTIYCLDHCLKVKRVIKCPGFVTDLHFSASHNVLLVVQLKLVTVYDMFDTKLQQTKLPYLNDNIVNQASWFDKDYMLVNESQSTLFVASLATYNWAKITPGIPHGLRIHSFYRIGNGYYLFQTTNSQSKMVFLLCSY